MFKTINSNISFNFKIESILDTLYYIKNKERF